MNVCCITSGILQGRSYLTVESNSGGILGDGIGEIESNSALALMVGEVNSSASSSAASRSAGNSPVKEVFSSSAVMSAREKLGRASSVVRVSWKTFVKRSKSSRVSKRSSRNFSSFMRRVISFGASDMSDIWSATGVEASLFEERLIKPLKELFFSFDLLGNVKESFTLFSGLLGIV